MATVTGLTAARMQEIYDASIVDASIDTDGNLILTSQGGTQFNVGDLHGPQGVPGPGGTITKVNGKTGSEVTLVPSDLGISTTSFVPTGTVLQTARSTAPVGYLLCQGQSLVRTDQPALFSAIGTAFGSQSSTTFNIPDYRGRVPVGRDTAQDEFSTLGQFGGAKTHKHTLDAGWARIGWGAAGRIIMRRITAPVTWVANAMSQSASAVPVVTANQDEQGGIDLDGNTDDTTSLPPYQVINYMIKT